MSDAPGEHRQHPRFSVALSMRVFDRDGQPIAVTETIDVSNGGALVAIPLEKVPDIGDMLRIELAVLVSPDTGEGGSQDVQRQARVVRHQPAGVPSNIAVGVEFQEVLNLGLIA
jgi:hypothetical protein